MCWEFLLWNTSFRPWEPRTFPWVLGLLLGPDISDPEEFIRHPTVVVHSRPRYRRVLTSLLQTPLRFVYRYVKVSSGTRLAKLIKLGKLVKQEKFVNRVYQWSVITITYNVVTCLMHVTTVYQINFVNCCRS